jgi:hypothetical protein
MDDQDIRNRLHSLLSSAFQDLTIYYRPPGDIELDRPCIVYEPKELEPSYSNNAPYIVGTRFQITILSNLPGYTDTKKMFDVLAWSYLWVSDMPGVTLISNRSYVSSDIVHDVFTISVHSIT